MSRYNNVRKAFNDTDRYKKTLKERGVKRIEQYRTNTFKQYNTETVPYIEKIYKDGDSFWKFSAVHYVDPSHWYVIARFNNVPCEANLSIGDVIKIPIDLSLALQVVV